MAQKTTDKKSYKKFLLLIPLVILLVFFLYECPAADKKDAGTYVVGYLTTWSYDCYKKLDYDILTHINIAFVNPDEEGNLKCAIPEKDLKKIVRKAHRHGVSVQIALGGGGGTAHYTELTTTKKSTKAFDKKIMEYVKEHDLDGVDIDIEGDVESGFWKTYDRWVKELAGRCHKKNLILSCAAASWYDKNIKKKTFERFDYISIMAYDNTGAKNPSSYDYAASCLDYFTGRRNLPAGKLVLGIPFYGYRYKDGVCTGKTVSYNEISTYNKGSENADASGTCRYNGINTVKKKTRLAKSYKGVMIWALGQDATGRKSLLRAIGDALSE